MRDFMNQCRAAREKPYHALAQGIATGSSLRFKTRLDALPALQLPDGVALHVKPAARCGILPHFVFHLARKYGLTADSTGMPRSVSAIDIVDEQYGQAPVLDALAHEGTDFAFRNGGAGHLLILVLSRHRRQRILAWALSPGTQCYLVRAALGPRSCRRDPVPECD